MNLSKKFIFYVLNLVFFIIIAMILYITIYSKNKDIYHEKSLIYEKLCNIDKHVDGDFVAIQKNITEQENSILKKLGYYKSIFHSNDQIVNSYKTKVLKLLKKMDINVKSSDIKQTQNNENIFLEVSFIAKYDIFCRFLFELEQFTKVESINYNYTGEASIKCSPILFSSSINNSFSGKTTIENMDDIARVGYFKEIAGKLHEIKDVGDIDTQRNIRHIPKNPFLYYVEMEGEKQ